MWEVRPITEDEADLFLRRITRAFGNDVDDEGSLDRFLELFELDRTFAAFDDGDIIGTGGAFSFDLTVPGGATTPMAGTTVITVQPTHRRRGVLRDMMSYHLDEVAARAEPLAALWASEATIYGRFGYGPATYLHEVEVDTEALSMTGPEPRGTVRLVEPEQAGPPLRSVYEQVRTRVPGMLSRSDTWWRLRRMRDDESTRAGKSARRYAVYEEEGSALGYATYRQKGEWSDLTPAGEIEVNEIITANHQAHRGLWGFLTNIDLFTRLKWWNSPVDDPLALSVTDPRRIRRRLGDAMWVRLVDVPGALQSRSYETEGAVTIEVNDSFRPDASGIYHLEVEDGVAHCSRSDRAPDATCEVDVLGRLYMGAGDALGLAAAGKLDGEPEAVRMLHRMFRTDRAPWCPEGF